MTVGDDDGCHYSTGARRRVLYRHNRYTSYLWRVLRRIDHPS